MSELILRRHMAENPLTFDAVRNHWRRQMRAMCPQQKRDGLGRFTNKGTH